MSGIATITLYILGACDIIEMEIAVSVIGGNAVNSKQLTEVVGRAKLQNYELFQSTEYYNLLSYDNTSPVQLASIGFDLYHNFPSLYHVQDLAIDLLLQVPPQTLDMFRNQLHLSMDTIPELPASRETFLEEYDS